MSNTSNYENLIDPTEFRSVQHYLAAADSEIDFVLHVKRPSMLAELAAELGPLVAERGLENGERVSAILAGHMFKGDLLLSGRHTLAPPFLDYDISASSIPAKTWSQVIYLPPFYLAHTPGLFEGTLVRLGVLTRHGVHQPKPRL